MYRGRLAPSPTGALHLGNARSFLIAWLRARSRCGQVVLRMEDLDHPKIKREFMDGTIEDLHWLGFDWDEGPDSDGDFGPYVQSQRLPKYRAALNRLRALGRAYPCTCSRRDVETAQSAPHREDQSLFYPGICRGRYPDYASARAVLPEDRLPAWRFRCPDHDVERFTDVFCGPQVQETARRAGDFVLARHPEGAGYMLAVVVDDAAMNISEVVRGDDLLPVTGRQLLLYRALDLSPPDFLHVPLVIGPDGRRLAKRHGDTRIASLRELGVAPERIIGLLAWGCGWASRGERLRPADLVDRFDLNLLPKEPVVLTRDLLRELVSSR